MKVRKSAWVLGVAAIGFAALFMWRLNVTPEPDVPTSRGPGAVETEKGHPSDATGSLAVICRTVSRSESQPTIRVVVSDNTGITREERALPVPGSITFPDLPAGEYTLETVLGRYMSTPTSAPVSITPGQKSTVSLSLDWARMLSGKISSSDGAVPRRVELAVGEMERWDFVEVNNQEYSYSLPAKPALAETVIFMRGEGYGIASRDVTIRPGEDVVGLDFRLEPAGSIAGQVTDAGGVPLAQTSVTITHSGDQRAVETSADGRFSFTHCAFGSYIVTARRKGFRSNAKEVSLKSTNARALVNLALDRGAEVRGFVLGPDNTPIHGATVRSGSASTKTSSSGSFTLSGMEVERDGTLWSVTAEAEGFADASFYDVSPESLMTFRLARTVPVAVELANLKTSFKNGVSVIFERRVPDPSDPSASRLESISVNGVTTREVPLAPGTYTVMARVGATRFYKQPVFRVDNEGSPHVRIDFSGVDVGMLKRSEAINAELSEVNRKITFERRSLSSEDHAALAEKQKALLGELKRIERMLGQ